jgi:chemotaxis protein CheC
MTAARGLSLLLDRRVAMEAPSVSIDSVEAIYRRIGGPETEVAGIYLMVSGDADGHILLLFPIPGAMEMIAILLGESRANEEFDELSLSALGEVGNIVGSAFLNHLGDDTGLSLKPSPPLVVMDMAGALMDTLLAEISVQGNDIVIIDAAFQDQSRATYGVIVLAPEPDAVAKILTSLG